MSRYIEFGIDLGTTNSAIAQCQGNDVRIFQSNDQANVTPSAVWALKTGRLIVGRRAYNAVVSDPDNVITEFKRWIGQPSVLPFPASGRSMGAEELSAEVLRCLVQDVHRQTGQQLDAAVVTVPADFSVLQCEATARAAGMAGLLQCPLMQEPIAAAVAYGAKPGAKDQRWLVFDLGGGTLDIAVISTREGQLNVLEHRGNKRLGGKDIDRLIVENLLLPALANDFQIPDPDDEPDDYKVLLRRLTLRAEEAKIDLTNTETVTVSLFDLGDDQAGAPIELEMDITRHELEELLGPFVERCTHLVREALDGARVSGTDLDRVLLVGGPTQMPVIRLALQEVTGASVDYSLDPMTVVARGAALYASTIEMNASTPQPRRSSAKVSAKLAFARVSNSLQPPVTGRIEGDVKDVKIDADGGYWTSGWVPVSGEGFFEMSVMLQEAKDCQFWLYARDASGHLLSIDPDGFNIRHGLEVAAPPLPHTVSLEVVASDGTAELLPLFHRGMPLPAEKDVTCRAAHTLRPSDPSSGLAIKFWEGETLNDPEANEWIGRAVISPRDVDRPVPAGAEINLSVKLDESRRISVTAFIPCIEHHFADHVYMPDPTGPDGAPQADGLPDEIANHLDRLNELDGRSLGVSDRNTRDELERLRQDVEDLDIEQAQSGGQGDPDQLARMLDASREIRTRLAALEKKFGRDGDSADESSNAMVTAKDAEGLISQYGTAIEQNQIALLRKELDRAIRDNDQRGIRKAHEDLKEIRWYVLSRQEWYWCQLFEYAKDPNRRFINRTEARHWLERGDKALQAGDVGKLEEAVRELWALLPQTQVKQDQDRAMASGIRKL